MQLVFEIELKMIYAHHIWCFNDISLVINTQDIEGLGGGKRIDIL